MAPKQRYDIENLLADLRKILVNNLNAAIAAVEAEKIAMGLPATGLQPIDTVKGYFEQTWSDAILNVPQAIFYGLEDIQAVGLGPATQQAYKIFVEIVMTDLGLDTLGKSRIHRYSRAIKDVIEANYDKLPIDKIKVKTVIPLSFKLELNSSEEVKIGGISIDTSLG